MKNKNSKIRLIAKAAIFSALIFCVTLIALPIGAGGYGHVGDAVIYVAALILPLPYAAAAAAIGAMLADFTLGASMYIVPSMIIKILLVAAAKLLMRIPKNPIVQDIFVGLSGVVTVIGYYVAEVVLLLIGNESAFLAALATAAASTIPLNVLQALASGALFMLLGGIIRKTSLFKNRGF